MLNNNYKMFWDCKVNGCFNDLHRLKFHVFKDCFPGKISFTDIDGIVEINGLVLMLEWKSSDSPLPTGQKIMFERLSKKDICVFVVYGNAENMEVYKLMQYINGTTRGWENIDLTGLKERISEWAKPACSTGRDVLQISF
jgi:hypothetical protein